MRSDAPPPTVEGHRCEYSQQYKIRYDGVRKGGPPFPALMVPSVGLP